MPAKLYKLDGSPPARAAMMACEIFGVQAEFIDVNIFTKDNYTPEYLEKNPLHTVPVFEDEHVCIHDSHAILQYLADKYGKDDSWYPKDVVKRAHVNQKLFFESGYLFPRIRNITFSAFAEGERKTPQNKLDAITECYGFLETFLSKSKFIAGDKMTIADISAIASVTSQEVFVPLDGSKYPKTHAWIQEMVKQPFCKKQNAPGVAMLREVLKKFIDF